MPTQVLSSAARDKLCGPYAELVGAGFRRDHGIELHPVAAHAANIVVRVVPERDTVRIDVVRPDDRSSTAASLPAVRQVDQEQVGCRYAALRMLGTTPAAEADLDVAALASRARARAEDAARWRPLDRTTRPRQLDTMRSDLAEALEAVLPALQIIVATRVSLALAAVAPDIIDIAALASAVNDAGNQWLVNQMWRALAPAGVPALVMSTWVVAVHRRLLEGRLGMPRVRDDHRTLPRELWVPAAG